MRDIAEAIGRGLKMPVKSVSPEEAQSHFGWLADVRQSRPSGLKRHNSQERLGWSPTGPGLIADLEQMRYHETDMAGASAARRA